jgi:hypothetical protein
LSFEIKGLRSIKRFWWAWDRIKRQCITVCGLEIDRLSARHKKSADVALGGSVL